MKNTIICLILGLLAALAPTSQGFVIDEAGKDYIKANGKTLHMRADSADFPSGGSRRSALNQAIDRWNDNPSDFQFTVSYESSVGFENDLSDIWFTTGASSAYWLSGAPAATFAWGNISVSGAVIENIAEADILVDGDLPWQTSGDLDDALAYDNASYRFLQTTLLHELGHALGLNHEDRYYNIMGTSVNFLNAYNEKVHFYPGEDACSGVVTMYSLDSSTQREDVSVTHWKYAGTDGTYSQHERCRIYKKDGTEVSVVSAADADPIFEVTAGQTIEVQLTYENSGYTYSVSPHVTYYFSTDEDIDSADTMLATRRPTLNRNRPFPFKQEMDVPTGLTSGDYWILAFVDDEEAIDEVNELNNKTYVRIRIK